MSHPYLFLALLARLAARSGRSKNLINEYEEPLTSHDKVSGTHRVVLRVGGSFPRARDH